jgi:hypothetical protein
VGKPVLVRGPVDGGRIEIVGDIKVIVKHLLAKGRGVLVLVPVHSYGVAEPRRNPVFRYRLRRYSEQSIVFDL